MKLVTLQFLMLPFLGTVGHCADTLTGNWKTENNETAMIAPCGPSYCITATTGKYAGQQLGSFTATSDAYVGRLTDPQNNATYSGKVTVSGNRLQLRGCATAVLCKTQTWSRVN